jgi:hypothetical protein
MRYWFEKWRDVVKRGKVNPRPDRSCELHSQGAPVVESSG